MMNSSANTGSILVLGIGNTLLSDDGFGVHVIESLRQQGILASHIKLQDGGTIGLNLLPDIEYADCLIVVDAAELDGAPGLLRTFENEEMDAHLSRHKSTVHEVAMMDLLCAARLAGSEPRIRVLIAVQPQSTDWGTEPTPAIEAAIPEACKAVSNIVRSWSHETA